MEGEKAASIKRGTSPKLLRTMVGALTALSIVVLTYMHFIYLPIIDGRESRQFLRAGRLDPAATDLSLREFYKVRAKVLSKDQQQVVDMTRHAWQGYRDFAHWSDYLDVQSMAGGTVYSHDMALTTVDSLDTLFIMGLHDEFDEASAWVKANLGPLMFQEGEVSFFEITIRSLGGLLSAYYLSGLPGSAISFGALGDSYYEYLLKQWLLTGKQNDQLKDMYITAVNGMRSELIGQSFPSNYTFVGKITGTGRFEAAMEHLTCFVPGMLALGYAHGMPASHLELAKRLTDTCVQMYLKSESHLAPEVTQFITEADDANFKRTHTELFVYSAEDHNILRPETVESLMILHRLTGDEIYREHGRIIMNAIEKHSKVRYREVQTLSFTHSNPWGTDDFWCLAFQQVPAGGYRSTENVWSGSPTTKDGTMESFFLAETLKYLYLLFSDDDLLPLDQIVFNTEAHPFPVI
ncbi:hypothetical protein BBJ28_00001256 [Nothophytophthora sp. Chile5]|nr:hypothetical protein BBJ28_00001256 [Nothophytophthora sp. Chile5]